MKKLLGDWIRSENRSALRTFLLAIQEELPPEASVYMVGGLVRDLLLGVNSSKDIDLMIDLCGINDLEKVLQRLQRSKFIKSFQCVGKSFPVFKIRIGDLDQELDLALARVEQSTGPGHRDFHLNAENISARQDGERRDFTINALFVRFNKSSNNELNFELIDYFGGLADLQSQKIRAVGDPQLRIIEDPLRILRAFRFSHQKNFRIDQNLWEVIRNQSSDLLPHLSPDRIQSEVIKTIVANPLGAIKSYLECDILEICFPDLKCHLPKQTPQYFPVKALPTNLIVFPLILSPWLELQNFKLKQSDIKYLENILQKYHIPNIREIKVILTGLLRLIHRQDTNYPEALQEKILNSHLGSEIFWLYTLLQRKFQFDPLFNLPSLPSKLDGKEIMRWGIHPGRGFEDVLMRVRQLQIEGVITVSDLRMQIITELSLAGLY